MSKPYFLCAAYVSAVLFERQQERHVALKALLLFDIDGTLVDTEGAGLRSLEEGLYNAFPDRAGTPFPPLDLGGATDGGVMSFLFEHFEMF